AGRRRQDDEWTRSPGDLRGQPTARRGAAGCHPGHLSLQLLDPTKMAARDHGPDSRVSLSARDPEETGVAQALLGEEGGALSDRAEPISPQTYARIGGLIYLFIIVAALFGEGVARGSLIVSRDAAATATNIQASETLFRAGLAGEMLTCVCDVALA